MPRLIASLLWLPMGLLCFDALAAQTTLRHIYRFNLEQIQIDHANGQVRTKEGPRTWERGQPELPYDVVTFLVPQGSRLQSVRADEVVQKDLAANLVLNPATTRRMDDGNEVEPPNGKSAPADQRTYPAHHVEYAGSGYLHGYQLMSFRLYPMQYDATGRRLLATMSMQIELQLADGGSPPVERERFREAIERNAERLVRQLVVNPEAMATYDRRKGAWIESDQRGFRPSDAPSLEGSPVDYVIITDETLASEFQTYANWKTRRGIPTVVRTTSWIEANYRHGSDLQETIRNFIKDAYAKWGIQYVLLGADTELLPPRFGHSEFVTGEEEIPTDMYFACLDGNWNFDRDALWGEAAVDSMDLGDDTDKYAEVYVGRLPVVQPSEANIVLNKIIGYENPTSSNYQDEVVFLSEVLFPVDWEPGQTITMDAGSFSDDIATFLPGCALQTKLYENYTQYPGSSELTFDATIAELNAGAGFVNHIGHGFRHTMSVGDQSLVSADAAALTNGDQTFILYLLNCSATAFDFPCLADAYMKNANGGAIAVLGSSRSAFPLPSYQYNREFFRALHVNGAANLGRAFVESRLPFTPNAFEDTSDHYTHYIYNFLGDPEMLVHTCELGTPVVSHPASMDPGSNDVLVNVTIASVPQEGVRVCLQKDVEEYVFGLTDANGDVTLEFVAETPGSVDVTVSGQNLMTYLGSITVNAAAGAYVHATAISVDDADGPSTSGNGDGIIDSNETLQLDVSFKNDGTQPAAGVTGVLRSSSPHVTVMDSVFTLGLVNVASTVNTVNELRISLSGSTPDGTAVDLQFETTDGVSTWTDTINRVVHSPVMDYVFLDVVDSMPGGNGDGIIQAGETVFLLPSFKNFGTGAADGLEASILTSDPDLTIVENQVEIGPALPQQEVTAPPVLQVTEHNVAEENAMLMILRDRYSRVWSFFVSLRPPAKPAAPVLDASQVGAIAASWAPSTEPDLAGYHVYRSQNGGGPFTRVTVDRTNGIAYYRDIGLSPNTEYFYFVTAVDSAGNESVGSDIQSINTVPAQLTGFPIMMGAESGCPPAVGDITGNGRREIVAGNDHLYAWDDQGLELLDDDQDPQTWGIFSEEMDIITAAIALAELDRSKPGLEVFATVWDDGNKAFVVCGDGTIPSGWPQNPDPGTPQKGYWGSPGTADVDGDNIAEVFAPAKNGNLYAWHADGTPLGASADWKANLGTWSRCSPTFANLDADPYQEIVYGSPLGDLHVWNADGSDLPNFPQSAGSFSLSSTAIGDINQDGTLDIVYITGGAVNVFDSATGTQLPGWPHGISTDGVAMAPSPALADFDFDGFLEVVIANNAVPASSSALRVLDYQGNVLPGWPQPVDGFTSESSPIVADFTGNGVPDIIFGNEGGRIFGWDKDGNDIPGFPLTTGDFVRATPTAADVDNDGDIELILSGWDRNLYVWDFDIAYDPTAAQWPTFKHDMQRSGFYGKEDDPTDSGDGDTVQRLPRKIELQQNVPNPFNPLTRIRYGVPGDVAAEAQLVIYDARGQEVRRLLQGPVSPGRHSVIWDGRDQDGRMRSSGVYFYRLQVGDTSLTRKMLLLK